MQPKGLHNFKGSIDITSHFSIFCNHIINFLKMYYSGANRHVGSSWHPKRPQVWPKIQINDLEITFFFVICISFSLAWMIQREPYFQCGHTSYSQLSVSIVPLNNPLFSRLKSQATSTVWPSTFSAHTPSLLSQCLHRWQPQLEINLNKKELIGQNSYKEP